jgi:hypothetical protein
MSASEPARHHLYEAARTGRWDDEAAEALMSLLPPVGWADVATKQDLRALEDSLRGDIAELRGETRGAIGDLRAEMHHEIGLVRSEIAQQTRTILLSLVGFLIGGAGVAIGTAQLIS